jgi:NADH-quinone oxidoreductase subunit C
MAELVEIKRLLDDRFPAWGLSLEEAERFPYIKVGAERIRDVCRYLRDEPRLDFNFLRCLTALDLAPEGFGVVYHLLSYHFRHELCLRVEVSRENPSVPSLAAIWPAADWHEREAFDLMGIQFEGHPDLRRLLLPDDWQGHPLRKDWVDPPTIYNIPTQRPSNLERVAKARAEKTGVS